MPAPQSRIPILQYRGRLAPSPTGYLHLGHARTFWVAQDLARAKAGTLILRNEDLDPARSKPEFVTAMHWKRFVKGVSSIPAPARAKTCCAPCKRPIKAKKIRFTREPAVATQT